MLLQPPPPRAAERCVKRAAAERLGEKSIEHVFRIDFADLDLKLNDILKLQVRAADGRPQPGPNEIWSVPRFVAIRRDASAPGAREVLARQKEISDELQAIQKELQNDVVRSDELAAEAKRDLDRDREFPGAGQIDQLARHEATVMQRLQELSDRQQVVRQRTAQLDSGRPARSRAAQIPRHRHHRSR